MLPEYRREKLERYVNKGSKLQSLGAGLLLRCFFGDKVPERNSQGKLYFDDGPFFNLSHSGRYAVLAVSDSPVGCDIEQMREIEFFKAGRIVFCDAEMDYLRGSSDTCDAFFRLWTRKEAFIKCIGEGFGFPPKSVDLSGDSASYDDTSYFFNEYMLGDYKIMLCSEQNSFPENAAEVKA